MIIKIMLYGALGAALALSGVNILKLEYWAILGIVMGIDLAAMFDRGN